MQIILSADMSTSGQDDGSLLFPINRQQDFPANTVAGMANEIQNNGYTMALMNGDLAYAECALPPSMPFCVKAAARCLLKRGAHTSQVSKRLACAPAAEGQACEKVAAHMAYSEHVT